MVEQLRKKALKSLIIKLIVCAIIIAVCLVVTKCSFIDYIKGPIDLTGTTDWNVDDLEGKYVTIDVDFVNMQFGEEVSTNTKTNVKTTTSICYVCEWYDVETNYDVFYGVKTSKSRSKGLDALYDAYDENDPYKDCGTYRVTGTFKKMTGEMLDAYDESIEYNFGASALDYAVPYCINDETIAGFDYFIFFAINAVAVLCLLGMIVTTICFFCGSYQKYIKKYLAKDSMESIQGIENDYMSAAEIGGCRLGRKYLFYPKGSTMNLIPVANQVWAYYYRRTGKNTISQIQLYNLDKKATFINIAQNPAQSVLQEMVTRYPHIVVGYDAELKNTFKNNFNAFLNIRYNAPSQAAAAQSDDWNL